MQGWSSLGSCHGIDPQGSQCQGAPKRSQCNLPLVCQMILGSLLPTRDHLMIWLALS